MGTLRGEAVMRVPDMIDTFPTMVPEDPVVSIEDRLNEC